MRASSRDDSPFDTLLPRAALADGAGRACLLLHSGGLDSTVLLYALLARGWVVRTLTVDYGQRHQREVDDAWDVWDALADTHPGQYPTQWPGQCAERVHLSLPELARVWGPRGTVMVPAVGTAFRADLLPMPDATTPEGHERATRATYIPARNLVLLALAYPLACADPPPGAPRTSAIALGVYDGGPPGPGDPVGANGNSVYPDCNPRFLRAMARAAAESLAGHAEAPPLLAPFLGLTKADVVAIGAALGVPFARTWTCYDGGARPCGVCHACVARAGAFAANGLDDPALAPVSALGE